MEEERLTAAAASEANRLRPPRAGPRQRKQWGCNCACAEGEKTLHGASWTLMTTDDLLHRSRPRSPRVPLAQAIARAAFESEKRVPDVQSRCTPRGAASVRRRGRACEGGARCTNRARAPCRVGYSTQDEGAGVPSCRGFPEAQRRRPRRRQTALCPRKPGNRMMQQCSRRGAATPRQRGIDRRHGAGNGRKKRDWASRRARATTLAGFPVGQRRSNDPTRDVDK